MELFERIRYLSDIKAISLAKLAQTFGVTPPTFHTWLKLGSQRNIWAHLPTILDMFPDVRREWLWWGEGEMLVESSSQSARLPQTMPAISTKDESILQLEQEILRLQKELLEAKDKIIALYEEQAMGRECTTMDAATRARGARLTHHDNESA